MPLASVTRLRVRSWRYLPVFLLQSWRSTRQARSAPGALAIAVLRDAHLAFWTRTVWSDEAAMRAFMRSGAHRRAMLHLASWCDEAAIVHWMQDGPAPPPWAEAHRRLQQQGRRSRVDYPSEEQRRYAIPPQRVGAITWSWRS